MQYTDLTPISSFRWTFWLLLFVVVILFAYDVYAASTAEPGDTISEVSLWTAWRFPVFPFIVGVICGHLFWPQWLASS